MRASPFGFNNFSRGLNALDSPYQLQDGEARDLLNIVSSPRGAIRKRYGSTVFASASQAAFPTMAVTDSFKRANENPLNNVGKWKTVEATEGGGSHNPRIVSEEAVATAEETVISASVWQSSVTNPAVSAKVTSYTNSKGVAGLIACYAAAEGGSFYVAKWLRNFGVNSIELHKCVKGVYTKLAEFSGVLGAKGNEIGLAVRGGVVSVYGKESAGSWAVQGEAADTALSAGFSGILVNKAKTGAELGASGLQNFATAEISTAPTETEFTSILPCQIGGVNYLIGTSKDKIYSITEGGTITDITDAAAVTTGLRWSIIQSTSGAPNRVVADGPVYLSNGIDPPRYWAGTEKATKVAEWTSKPEGAFAAVPKAQYLTYLGNRIWASGIAGDTSAVRFSGFAVKTEEGEQADPTNWPKENVVWFEKEDGEPITGTGIAGSYLMVFKAHKTWAVYDLNEGENRRLSDSVGCVAYRSIVQTPQGTFFLTPDQGVYVTNGTTLREVSREVRPILQGLDSNIHRSASQPQLKYAAGGFLNGHYYLSYMAKDETWKTLDYDTALQSWWLHDLAGLEWAHWEPQPGNSSLYTIPSAKNTGVVKAFVPGVYVDSGASYAGGKYEGVEGLSCYWLSPWEPFFQYVLRHRINQPQTKKRIRTLFVDGKGELVVKVAKKFGASMEELKGVIDNADGSAPASPVKLGTTANEVQAARYYSLGVSRVWSFLFGNAGSEPLEIEAYAVDLSFRKS